MTIIIIIGIIGVLIYFFSQGQSKSTKTSAYGQGIESETKQTRHYSDIRKYEREKLNYKLKGVAFDNRTEAYDEVETGDIVSVRFDDNNQYDKNALGVYTQTRKLLGYIEKDQRILIKTLRDNPNNLCYINEKIFVPPNGEYKNPYRGIEIEIWVGFPDNELTKEKQRRIDRKAYYDLSQEFDLQLSIAKETKESNPEKAIEVLEDVTEKMNQFNTSTVDEKKFKLPLHDLLILTNKQGLYTKTIEVGEKYLTKSNLTDKQKEDILKRIEKAKEKRKE